MLARGVVGSVLVLLGSLVVATVPGSSWAATSDVLAPLRASEAGRMLGLSVVMAGLGLLAHSWLLLCRHTVRARGPGRDGLVATTRRAALLWSAPLLLAPPLFSRDGWSYAAQGVLAQWGVSPYKWGPGVLHGPASEAVDPQWLWSPSPYGPVPLGFGKAAAALTENPWLLVVAHRGLALIGLLLLAWAVPRLAVWGRVDPALASAVVLASPFVLANGVGGLHNDLLMAGLMAAAMVVAAERGWAWGAVLGGLAAAVKLPGGVVCLGVVLVTLPALAGPGPRVRRLAQVAAVSVGVLLGAGVLVGTGAGWVQALGVPGTVATPLSVTTLIGGAGDAVAGWLDPAAPEAAYLSLVRLAGTVATVAVAAWVALRWTTGSRSASVSAVALVTGTVVALSPVVHLWYLLWVLPFVAALRLSRVAMTALVALSVVLGLVAPLDSSLHGAYLAIVLGTMLAGVLVCVLLLTPGARARVRRIAAPGWIADADTHAGVPVRLDATSVARPEAARGS